MGDVLSRPRCNRYTSMVCLSGPLVMEEAMSQPPIYQVLDATRELVAALQGMPEHQRTPLLSQVVGRLARDVAAPGTRGVLVLPGRPGVVSLDAALAELLEVSKKLDEGEQYETEAAPYRLVEALRERLDDEMVAWLEG